jgi:hypothetical protein
VLFCFSGATARIFAKGKLPGKWRRGIEFYKKLCYTETNNTKGGRNMKKEKITLEAIKQDLLKIVNFQLSNKVEWRFSYIIPITILAVMAGVYFKNIFVGLLVFSIAAYHIVRYAIEYKEYKTNKNAIISLIERGEISIATEILSHIANETIYEPHQVRRGRGRRANATKTITVYYFDGGASWRVPTVEQHYSWSKDFYISSKGLGNISMKGDEFYFVSLQSHRDIAYIYPCKNFELDKSLNK